jgi:hypothetical protein
MDDTKSCVDMANKKWEVITVDDNDDDTKVTSDASKKRGVVSPTYLCRNGASNKNQRRNPMGNAIHHAAM